tara:strand:- start:543 stop:680 length:138 start_codon:yes stop_codon:yes gene_type:complete
MNEQEIEDEAYQIIATFYTHHTIDKKDLDSKFVEWWHNCLVSENE